MPYLSSRKTLHRRTFLKGAGTAIALPLLNAMMPTRETEASADSKRTPRFLAICGGLGFHAEHLFPKTPGKNYELTPYLKQIEDHRNEFTIFSGLSHPNQNGNNGHASSLTWLTSAQRPGLAGFKNTISLDQLIANHIGIQTRFPFLTLSNTGGGSLSWTSNGVNIPAQSSPAKLFKKLFIEGTPEAIANEIRELKRGKSILDTVLTDANKLNRTLSVQDQQKLDEYFTAIRDLEQRLKQSEEWARKPKPKLEYKQPTDVADKKDIIAKQKLMYDMIVLALQTDSTRSITLALGGMNAVPSNLPGVKTDWHNLSHHGKDPAKISELKIIEEAEFTALNGFLSQLKEVKERDRTLLDETAVLFGSNLGNASSHSWRNLPIILAGGGYQHGAYVAHDAKNNTPFANLFVALAQRMGVETTQFGSSTSDTIRGLET